MTKCIPEEITKEEGSWDYTSNYAYWENVKEALKKYYAIFQDSQESRPKQN